MMRINAQTKIADLLKYHPDALEAIVSLSPDFKKLRNPILRRLMAGRTSISMASKIGGCKPKDFFEKLTPLGFVVESEALEEDQIQEQKPLPDFLRNPNTLAIVSLDVRETLAAGADPLKMIQQTVKELGDRQVLKIINTFEPVPLIMLLKKQGFEAHVDFAEKDRVETYFYRAAAMTKQADEPSNSSDDWQEILAKHEGHLRELDVRHLPMPKPMMTILEALEQLPNEEALFIYHKKVPVFLLPELTERKFSFRIKELADGEVRLLIFKS